MLTVLPVDAPVTCLRFGSYGREANTLLIATKAGSLFVKMLRRGANLETLGHAGPPPEQDVPLALLYSPAAQVTLHDVLPRSMLLFPAGHVLHID